MTGEFDTEAEQHRRNVARGRTGLVLVGVFLLALIGWSLRPQAPPDWLEPLSPESVERCRTLLASVTDSGIIRGRPAPNRIDVDEARWGSLPDRVKDRILRAVTCDLWQTAMPAGSNRVVAYGAASGKPLRALTSTAIVTY
jgi:hypothetical protein